MKKGHYWTNNLCKTCGLVRRAFRPSGSSQSRYLYRYEDEVGYKRTMPPPCRDNQLSFFDVANPIEEEPVPEPAPAKKEKPKKERKLCEMPEREPSVIELRVSPVCTLLMDGDGRWGGRVTKWQVLIIPPPKYLTPSDAAEEIEDTWPCVMEKIERKMRAYSIPDCKIVAKSSLHQYVWKYLFSERYWKLCG